MKVTKIKKYKCEICGTNYDTRKEAKECEAKPITKDKGVKVGDKVIITDGCRKGSMAKVDEIFILSMDWGHYDAELYHHTIALWARIGGSHRLLTFDSYQQVNQ